MSNVDLVEEELDKLSKLEPYWDGYGGKVIDPEIIQAVRKLVQSIPMINKSYVVPTSRGGIQLEWHRKDKILELEFEDHLSIYYLKFDRTTDYSIEDTIQVSDLNTIQELISWINE